MKTGKHGGVATICLHPIARLRWDQRWRHHVTSMAKACELAMNAMAARSSLITKRQRLAGTPKTVAELADGARIIGNLAKVTARFPPPRSRFALCEYPSQQIGYFSFGPSPMHEKLWGERQSFWHYCRWTKSDGATP